MYRIIADMLIVIHFIWIVFMIWVFLKTIISVIKKNYKFLNNVIIRTLHLLGIFLVAIFIIIDKPCPITIWENKFRMLAGETVYKGSFIVHYIEKLVYPDVPPYIVEIPSILIGLITVIFYIFIFPFKKK